MNLFYSVSFLIYWLFLLSSPLSIFLAVDQTDSLHCEIRMQRFRKNRPERSSEAETIERAGKDLRIRDWKTGRGGKTTW